MMKDHGHRGAKLPNLLRRENFHSWHANIRSVLQSTSLLFHIDYDVKLPLLLPKLNGSEDFTAAENDPIYRVAHARIQEKLSPAL